MTLGGPFPIKENFVQRKKSHTLPTKVGSSQKIFEKGFLNFLYKSMPQKFGLVWFKNLFNLLGFLTPQFF